MSNLWGDLSNIKVLNTPQKILNEQAGYLNNKTENKVLASLIKSKIDKTDFRYIHGMNFDFNFDFILTSPNMKGYNYKMFKLQHNVEIYPLYIELEEAIGEEVDEKLIKMMEKETIYDQYGVDSDGSYRYMILNEEVFINSLRIILSSDSVKRIISSILSLGENI